ncbi:XdhC family protein [Agrobacterium sp. S2]|nr:XdhC family protein [Agrobacterium sp. S2]
MGSAETHRRRCDRLRTGGFWNPEIAELKAPVGMFGPTKASAALAVSIVADVIAARLAAYS